MNLNLFAEITIQPVKVEPVIDYSVRGLCARPYPLHPKGCPNLGKCDRCPPTAVLFDRAYDLTQPVFAVINNFNLEEHVTRVAEKNPTWSDRQLRCVLYWQPKARKQLEAKIQHLQRGELSRYSVERCPEAMGVNVTETLANAGIFLEWPPVQIARQVALFGMLKQPPIISPSI